MTIDGVLSCCLMIDTSFYATMGWEMAIEAFWKPPSHLSWGDSSRRIRTLHLLSSFFFSLSNLSPIAWLQTKTPPSSYVVRLCELSTLTDDIFPNCLTSIKPILPSQAQTHPHTLVNIAPHSPFPHPSIHPSINHSLNSASSILTRRKWNWADTGAPTFFFLAENDWQRKTKTPSPPPPPPPPPWGGG